MTSDVLTPDIAGWPLSPGARDFVTSWIELWKAPSGDAVRPMIHPDIVGVWAGSPAPIEGTEPYVAQIQGVADRAPGLQLRATAAAGDDELVFVSWQAVVGGQPVGLQGIDRFRLRDGRVAESLVRFDPAEIPG